MYSEVAKEVEPKRLKLAEMNDKLSKANAELKEKQDSLNEVIEKVKGLQEKVCGVCLFVRLYDTFLSISSVILTVPVHHTYYRSV